MSTPTWRWGKRAELVNGPAAWHPGLAGQAALHAPGPAAFGLRASSAFFGICSAKVDGEPVEKAPRRFLTGIVFEGCANDRAVCTRSWEGVAAYHDLTGLASVEWLSRFPGAWGEGEGFFLVRSAHPRTRSRNEKIKLALQTRRNSFRLFLFYQPWSHNFILTRTSFVFRVDRHRPSFLSWAQPFSS